MKRIFVAAASLSPYRCCSLVSSPPSPGDAAALVSSLSASTASEAGSSELSFLYDGSDSYLKPFLADDSLLFSLPRNAKQPGEEADEDDEEEEKESAGAAPGAAAAASAAPSLMTLLRENQTLRNELSSMAESMGTMQAALKRVAFADEDEEGEKAPALASSSSSAAAASSSNSATPAEIAAAKAAKAAADAGANPGSFAPDHVDRDYFGGYSTRNIHELMLRDTVRTEAYRDFIYKNAHVFKDKVVLDVGCGTGILSMFAAKAGAKMVIGVDAADIAFKAREIIATNKLSHIITVLHGKMEEVTLPVDKVDIIVSEWMGYFLLFESMLPSVLYARDKYLRAPPSASQAASEATGVYPDRAVMYVAGIETTRARSQKVDWWGDVYGFDMSCLVDERERFQGSTVEIVRPGQVLTSAAVLQQFDCNTVADRALDFASDFVLEVGEDPQQNLMSGFMVYFDTLFELHCSSVINLSTAPVEDRAPLPELTTHWQQSVFYLAKPLQVQKGDKIEATLKATRSGHTHAQAHAGLPLPLAARDQSATPDFCHRVAHPALLLSPCFRLLCLPLQHGSQPARLPCPPRVHSGPRRQGRHAIEPGVQRAVTTSARTLPRHRFASRSRHAHHFVQQQLYSKPLLQLRHTFLISLLSQIRMRSALCQQLRAAPVCRPQSPQAPAAERVLVRRTRVAID